MVLLDTHALVWWLSEPSRLSAKAARAIQSAARDDALLVSAASILEIATLVRRKRLALLTDFDLWLNDVCCLPELRIEPVTVEIAARTGGFDDEMQGDPMDRLIAATALVLRVPLVSADGRLQALSWLQTIW